MVRVRIDATLPNQQLGMWASRRPVSDDDQQHLRVLDKNSNVAEGSEAAEPHHEFCSVIRDRVAAGFDGAAC